MFALYLIIKLFPLFPLPYVQLHRLMCQAAELFFAGKVVKAVSYTHLDVYKRQALLDSGKPDKQIYTVKYGKHTWI